MVERSEGTSHSPWAPLRALGLVPSGPFLASRSSTAAMSSITIGPMALAGRVSPARVSGPSSALSVVVGECAGFFGGG